VLAYPPVLVTKDTQKIMWNICYATMTVASESLPSALDRVLADAAAGTSGVWPRSTSPSTVHRRNKPFLRPFFRQL
jgi:hypothetical protein